MKETNYCAHAIDDLRWLSNAVHPEKSIILLNTVSSLIPKLRNSIKFRVPDDGKIFDLRKGETLSLIMGFVPNYRIPFPVIALEWPITYGDFGPGKESYDATICVVYEEDFGGEIRLVVYPMIRTVLEGRKRWVPINFGVSICEQGVRPFPVTEAGFDLCKNDPNDPAIWDDITNEVTTVAQFLAALACSNSATADAPPPNQSLNAKRKSSGKTPFFSYKVLTISASGSDSKGVNAGGTNGSPRVHLRRGHIRRLTDKTVWVNACVVGDKSKGMVVKDYQVTA